MDKAQSVAYYINSLPDFTIQEDAPTGYDHMGALLVDATLQAGIKYETVVLSCLESVLANYPEAKTTSQFQRVLIFTSTTSWPAQV
jgi:hypothetical protein